MPYEVYFIKLPFGNYDDLKMSVNFYDVLLRRQAYVNFASNFLHFFESGFLRVSLHGLGSSYVAKMVFA